MARSNDQLIEFLATCDAAECFAVLASMKSSLSPTSEDLNERYASPEALPDANTPPRRDLAVAMVELLRWYGSDSIAYGMRAMFADEAGVDYTEVCRDVAILMNAHQSKGQKIAIPKAADATDYEQLVVQLVLGSAFEKKSADEIAAILEESGVGKDAAQEVAKKYVVAGVPAIAIGLLIRLLGKRVVQTVVERVVMAVVSSVLTKQAAEMVAKRLVIQMSQKALSFWLGVVAILWTVLDVTKLVSGPANRVTVPTVTLIASLRLRKQLGASDQAQLQ